MAATQEQIDQALKDMSDLREAVQNANDPDTVVERILSNESFRTEATKTLLAAGDIVRKDDISSLVADEMVRHKEADEAAMSQARPPFAMDEQIQGSHKLIPEYHAATMGAGHTKINDPFGYKDSRALVQKQLERSEKLHRRMAAPNAYMDMVFTDPVNDRHRELQDLNDALIFTAGMMEKLGIESGGMYKNFVQGTDTWNHYLTLLQELDYVKANEVTSTAVTEWIPTLLSAQFLEILRLELRIPSLFTEISMPSPSYDVPLLLSSLVAKKIAAEATAATGQSYTSQTGKLTLSAKKIMVLLDITGEANEDSIIPLLPLLRAETARAFAEGWEDAIINGDSDSTHMDNDIATNGDAEDIRKIWKGLRALNPSGRRTDFAGAMNVANLRSLRGSLGKYAVNPNDAVYIFGVAGYLSFLKNITDIQTVDKYGPQASIITGEVAKFDGIPIVISGFVREVLSATGFNTSGGPNTFTVCHLVSPRGFIRGNRRSLSFETDRDIRKDLTTLVASQRGDFARTFAAETTDAMGIELPLT